ncbi:hypothetical protein O181_079868 [Austropuccinia psidii MF-1]|uniref:Uncharacterized protein n=1 Tax=Austropuccinia psidii MF-1 TaxID=1389203 RepID=A0A9Q3FHK8_9BASI|nr:hypothetical protein [Austropuccinia psidii MF-1]
MNSYLHIKSFLGQEKTIECLGGWIPLSCKDKVKKIKNWLKTKSFICRPAEGIESFGRRPSGVYQIQNHRKRSPKDLRRRIKVPRTIRERAKAKQIGTDLTHKGTGSPSWSLQPWTVSLIWPGLSYTEWYKLTNVRHDSTTNTFDRIESKIQAQNDEMEDLSILNINDQVRILKDHVLEIINNTNQFATHLKKSESERQTLRNEIIANLEQIHKNYEPHMPRNSTPFTEEKISVKGSLTPFLGENPICAKDIPKLEEWPTFSGEGEYNHIELIRTIDIFQEDFHIPDEIIVGKLHSLFTRTAKKQYYKMRLDHGKNDWPWWKFEIITNWANNSWRFRMENDFESAIFNSEKDKPLTWFLKQKDRLSALHPDMSDSMINMKILRKCGGELEHAIKCRCVEPCSTED